MPSNLTCGSAAERRQVFLSFASLEEKPPPLTPTRQRLIPNHLWQDTQDRQSAKFLANGALIGGATCRHCLWFYGLRYLLPCASYYPSGKSRSTFCCLGKCIRSSADVKYLYSLRKKCGQAADVSLFLGIQSLTSSCQAIVQQYLQLHCTKLDLVGLTPRFRTSSEAGLLSSSFVDFEPISRQIIRVQVSPKSQGAVEAGMI